jgi:hypothetical protein
VGDTLARCIGTAADTSASPVFAFSRARRLRAALAAAGFHRIGIDRLELRFASFRSRDAYWSELRSLAPDLFAQLSQLPPAASAAVRAELFAELARHRRGGGVAFDGVTWIASGERT